VGRPLASIRDACIREAQRSADWAEGRSWPAPQWQKNPVGFAETILGVKLWKFQREFLEAIRDHRHVAVAGGRKIGKDFAVAVAALWWYCSFPNARVIMLAPKQGQIDDILYREIRIIWYQSGRCVACKKRDPDGEPPCDHSALLAGKVRLSADSGIVADDFREIVGTTAVREGGMRGMSGARILAIEDEASDIKDEFDTALVGNLAGADCHRVAISNPSRLTGFFYRAFHEERDLYYTMQVSSNDNPNIVAGKNLIPGLADAQWITERKIGWGVGSRKWLTDVEGQFPRGEKGQLVTLDMLHAASMGVSEAPDDGRLHIGVDVGGSQEDGDETVIYAIRGCRPLRCVVKRGMTPEEIRDAIREVVKDLWRPGDVDDDKPLVVLDRAGGTGAKVYDVVNAYHCRNDATNAEFALIGFQGGMPPLGRAKESYRYNRDALFGGLVDWLRAGGKILPDVKLEGELLALQWGDSERGKSQLCPKSEMKEKLGRSPDRLDALALATWGETRMRPVEDNPPPVVTKQSPTVYETSVEAEATFDPYEADWSDPRNRRR
jgi:phage terminase large subunit